MMEETTSPQQKPARPSLWKSIGPALITACVVFGPGSLLISSNIGANHGYQLVWLLLLTGVLMGTYLTMGARIGVVGGASPCSLVAPRLGRPAAFIIGLTLSMTCGAFQFSNNLALGVAVGAFLPKAFVPWVVVAFNVALIAFLFKARHIYNAVERVMKIMVAVILLSFLFSLIAARPDLVALAQGFIPSLPETVELRLPRLVGDQLVDPMILVASLLGTTFSVAGAFFQGNLVREKGWTLDDYRSGVGDAIAGVTVLTSVSMVIMVTAGTVIRGKPADDIGQLALTLQPLLGPIAFVVFSIGLLAVAMNPFLINAMIGGTILADGIGLPARLSDRWPRIFTVLVMMVGMAIALVAMQSGERPINLIIFGQSLTVLGNPLMALAMLWLANRKDVMGERRNKWYINVLGVAGFLVVLFMAVRVLWTVLLRLGIL